MVGIEVEQADSRARVRDGTGSSATAEAVRLMRFATRAGADGALVIAPFSNRPSQEGLYAHFGRIAEAA
ncbi:MAG: dihydrodipicolinate synthase family protein, partial [Singulisphaera sp.]|nr:dihydrodipicolinate synthase family protein [Singulisphaera sp.]